MAEKLTFKKAGSVAWDYIQLTVGTLLYCLGWTSFLIPNGITSGGLTGLCTTIQFGLGIPVGISFPVLNTCLLILGFLFLGKAFGFRTIYVIALSSVLFKVLPDFPVLEVLMEEKLLVCLLGAGMEAVGIGITLNKGGSTGGTDIIAMLVNKYWPVSPGRVYLICDIFIVSMIFLLPDKGIVDIIYAVVVMVTFSLGVDYVLMGRKTSVQILVFSSKYEEIANHMIHDMNRGVTALDSVGWYTQKEGKVLLIVARKQEMNNVIRAIKEIDKSAFISVSTAKSVYGEGFEEVKTGIKKRKDKNEK